MSIRIPGGHDRHLQRALQQTSLRLERSHQRLASGRRIATAADDAAGLALSKRLEAAVRGTAQGERNLGDGVDLARTAAGALQGMHEGLARMRELAVQAQNGTLSADDRAAVQQEYDQIAASLDQTAGGTSFGGRALLDGSAGGSGAITLTDGQGSGIELDLPPLQAAALGVAGRNVAEPTTLAAIDTAITQVSHSRIRLGSAENHLQGASQRLAAGRTAAAAARSRIEDADYAFEVASQTRDRILLGLQVASLRHANRVHHGLDRLG